MLTSPPITVAAGTPASLATPGNSPWAAVVISNLSPFLLQIQGGVVGGAAWLEPFTANLYCVDGSHAPIGIEPQSLGGVTPAAGAGSQVQATWYAPGEEPSGSWPVSLTAQAISAGIAGVLSTQGQTDVLISGSTRSSVGNSINIPTIAAQHSYNALVVTCTQNGAGTPACAVVQNSEGISFCAAFANIPEGTTTWQAIVPITCTPSDTLSLSIIFNSSGVSQIVTVAGTTSGPVPLMRSDGRAYPLGVLNVSALTAGAGNFPLFGAPLGPLRVLLKTVHVSGANFADISGTIGGAVSELVGIPTIGGALIHDFVGGILLDPGTNINGSAGAAQCRTTIDFDLVA